MVENDKQEDLKELIRLDSYSLNPFFPYKKVYQKDWIAEFFCKFKNGSSIITSKNLSKNLSNESKQWCFCCLYDKTLIKMPILRNIELFTEILWQIFWCNNGWSIFDVVTRLRYWLLVNSAVHRLTSLSQHQLTSC